MKGVPEQEFELLATALCDAYMLTGSQLPCAALA